MKEIPTLFLSLTILSIKSPGLVHNKQIYIFKKMRKTYVICLSRPALPLPFVNSLKNIFKCSKYLLCPGKDLVPKQTIQIQEAHETRRWRHRRQRFGHRPRTVQRLPLGGTCLELADHCEDSSGGHDRVLHPQLHLVVSHHTPGVYATVTAHVRTRSLSSRTSEQAHMQPLLARYTALIFTHNTKPGRSLLPHGASSHRGLLRNRVMGRSRGTERGESSERRSIETEKGAPQRGAPEATRPVRASGNRRQMDPFLAAVNHLCVL